MSKKEKRFQTSSFNYVLLNIYQREKLEDLSFEEVYQECIDSTQDCIKLQDKYDDIAKNLTDIYDLRLQPLGLGALVYCAYTFMGYKWYLGKKLSITQEKLEQAKLVDEINWETYSQRAKKENSADLDTQQML